MLAVPSFRQIPGRCGSACLKMIAHYYGINVAEPKLARLMKTSRRFGTKAEAIVNTAKQLGFQAKIKDNGNSNDLQKYLAQNIPVIVAWFSEDDGHYSVVIGLDTHNIYLQDPQLGHVRSIQRAVFFRIWFDFWGDYLRNKDSIIIRRLIAVYP